MNYYTLTESDNTRPQGWQTLTIDSGQSYSATGEAADIFGDAYFIYYNDPQIALMMNPLHFNFSNPLVWNCSVSGEIKTGIVNLYSGAKEITYIDTTGITELSESQKVAFGITCYQQLANNVDWIANANKSLSDANDTYTPFQRQSVQSVYCPIINTGQFDDGIYNSSRAVNLAAQSTGGSLFDYYMGCAINEVATFANYAGLTLNWYDLATGASAYVTNGIVYSNPSEI